MPIWMICFPGPNTQTFLFDPGFQARSCRFHECLGPSHGTPAKIICTSKATELTWIGRRHAKNTGRVASWGPNQSPWKVVSPWESRFKSLFWAYYIMLVLTVQTDIEIMSNLLGTIFFWVIYQLYSYQLLFWLYIPLYSIYSFGVNHDAKYDEIWQEFTIRSTSYSSYLITIW